VNEAAKNEVYGCTPTHWHLSIIASRLGELRVVGRSQVMLSYLPVWKTELQCRTEDVVEMLEYLVETGSPLMRTFSLDMHLVDAVIQCRLQRQGLYYRNEWIGRTRQ
jgi:hypothetical protein